MMSVRRFEVIEAEPQAWFQGLMHASARCMCLTCAARDSCLFGLHSLGISPLSLAPFNRIPI